MAEVPNVKLNNGVEMPLLGFGAGMRLGNVASVVRTLVLNLLL